VCLSDGRHRNESDIRRLIKTNFRGSTCRQEAQTGKNS
jgi:hypothetical protein